MKRKKHQTVAFAESCTGGLVSHLLTNIPGSSQFFRGAVIAYSDDCKIRILKVPPRLIKKHGSVSEEVAVKMAEGARRLFESDMAVSVTGIAGPGGATATKPIGLAYIAVATAAGTRVEKVMAEGTRVKIKRQLAERILKSAGIR